MTDAERLARADCAKKLMDEPFVKEAFEIIEKAFFEAFVECPNRDSEGMQLMQIAIRHSRQFKGIFLGAIEQGKLTQQTIQSLAADTHSRYKNSF